MPPIHLLKFRVHIEIRVHPRELLLLILCQVLVICSLACPSFDHRSRSVKRGDAAYKFRLIYCGAGDLFFPDSKKQQIPQVFGSPL